MERLFGVALSDLDGIRKVTQREPELVLIAALNTWLTSLASCRTFHADLHAGNMLVLRCVGAQSIGHAASLTLSAAGHPASLASNPFPLLLPGMVVSGSSTLASSGACLPAPGRPSRRC